MRAAAALGPNARMRTSASWSTTPPTSGASGPTTTKSHFSSLASRTRPGTSSPATSKHGTRSPAMPALPGAASSSGRCGLRNRERTIACSRPPPPTTSTRTGTLTRLEGGYEVVDGNCHEGLVPRRSAGPELERHARHRLLVRRLHDVHEVVAAERGPLRLDGGTELLDLLVHLANSRRVVLDGLNPLRGERAQEHERWHGRSFPVLMRAAGFLASFPAGCKPGACRHPAWGTNRLSSRQAGSPEDHPGRAICGAERSPERSSDWQCSEGRRKRRRRRSRWTPRATSAARPSTSAGPASRPADR